MSKRFAPCSAWPAAPSEILTTTKARGHRVIAGRLLKKHLSFPNGPWPLPCGPQEGDFPDRTEVRDRAAGIAAAMQS